VNKVKLYGLKDDDQLLEEPEAVVDRLRDFSCGDPMPKTVEVYEFEPRQVPPELIDRMAERALEDVIYTLDEELGNPEIQTELSDKMLGVMELAVQILCDWYTPYQCVPTGKTIMMNTEEE
jgi:hypothetical protein